jgi:hypothetical protein
MRTFFLLSVMLLVATRVNAMDQAVLEQYINDHTIRHQGRGGVVQFEYESVPMMAISDPRHDRMRIIAPVARYGEVSREQLDSMMEANFHTALDARYGVSRGVVYAAFLHPLSSLDTSGVQSALEQVANLALTYGKTYSSGELRFGNPR